MWIPGEAIVGDEHARVDHGPAIVKTRMVFSIKFLVIF